MTSETGFAGVRVLALESRRAAEIAELIRRHGGVPTVAPSMRELPLSDNPAAGTYLDELAAGQVDATIFLTGVGTRTLVATLASRCSAADLATLLRRHTVVVRGPKPVAALREIGVTADVTVPEPNTWRDVLATLDRDVPVAGRQVAVQEYGVSNEELLSGLRARGARVLAVPVYRWALPLDLAPLRSAIQALASGTVDLMLCTSATQIYHLFQVARDELGSDDALRAALRAVVVASIGPICSEALRRHEVRVDLEPEHPKMGHLVAAAARQCSHLLATKR